MSITLRLATRDWDYLTPLALGDLRSSKFDLQLTRVNALPDNLADEPHFDAAEMSLSRYALSRAKDIDDGIIGIPYFLMRAFRHRCIITTQDSPLKSIADLKGKRIGLTGWQDSGNTWTRAILRREGINVEDNQWFLSRLTDEQPAIVQRGDHFTDGVHIHEVENETPLISLLQSGKLDAVFTAFMPSGFFSPTSGLRQLLPHFPDDECHYFNQVKYVPGIHILGIKKSIWHANPWIIDALCELLDESVNMWQQKREKYAETTPWIIDELRRTAQQLPPSWHKNGFSANKLMIADFATEQFYQNLTDRILTPEQLFPYFKSYNRG